MNESEICKQVAEIITDITKCELNAVTDKDKKVDELLDSIQFVLMVVEIEKKFDIEIVDVDFQQERLNSIKNISQVISEYWLKDHKSSE